MCVTFLWKPCAKGLISVPSGPQLQSIILYVFLQNSSNFILVIILLGFFTKLTLTILKTFLLEIKPKKLDLIKTPNQVLYLLKSRDALQ